MSPLVAYHATRSACRDGISRHGLLANRPTAGRPYGVYVFRSDGSLSHVGWRSRTVWEPSPVADVWEVAYIGRLMIDKYVLNGMILLDPVEHVTLVAGNS